MSIRPLLRPPLPLRFSRPFSTTPSIRRPAPASIPYIQSCPSPTCACAPTPPDLDIDRKTPLLNTMASYSQQVVICTGKDDWSSRIEDEKTGSGEFIRGLKGVVGKGGEAFDPFTNILLTTSSFPQPTTPHTTTALLLPSFKRLTVPNTPSTYTTLATAYLKPTTLHPHHASLSTSQKNSLLRDPTRASELPPPTPITNLTILICGHGSRDTRCGILGPLLRSSFEAELARKNITADVGLISHIGGHKFAGNVIIYVPPTWDTHALRGCGIWYGRVGPEEVEGVVGETVVGGRVVGDLFRGGVGIGGRDLGREVEAQIKRKKGTEEAEGLRLRPKARG